MKPINIRQAVAAMTLGSLLYCPILHAAEGDILFETTFDTDGEFEGWFDNNDRMKQIGWNDDDITGEEMVIGGVFAAKVIAGDPQLVTNTGSGSTISLDANTVGSMAVRIRQSADDGVTWKTAGDLVITDFLAQVQGVVVSGVDNISQVADETDAGDGWTVLTFNLLGVFNRTITDVRIDPSSTLDESFEIDWIRLLETEVAPPFLVVTDPEEAIPEGFLLLREWDTAAQLADLNPGQLTKTFEGEDGVVIGPCSVDENEDCLAGVSSTNDPTLATSDDLNVPLEVDQQLIVEIGFVVDAEFGPADTELFWDDAAGGFAGVRRVPIPAVTADDQLHVVRITWSNGSIDTRLDALRYDPARATGIDIEVDYIRVYTDAPFVPPPAEYAWDADPGTAGPQGGTGDWSTSNNFWNDGMSNISWPSVATGDDNAIFGGTAGTVTIDDGGITATSLEFAVDGYTLGGGTLILDSSLVAPKLTVVGGAASATVEALVDGTDDDVRKEGTGALTLSNAANVFNSFTTVGGITNIPTGASLTTTGTNPTENGFAFKLKTGAVLNIDGTVVADAGSFGGFSGNANWTVNVNEGADLTLSNAYAGWNASVTYNFNGGTTNATGFLRHQDGGTGTINVSGGTHTFGGQLGAVANGNNSNTNFTITGGTFVSNTTQFNPSTGGAGQGSNNQYTINLDGGTLETSRVSIRRGNAPAGPGTHTMNLKFNGGVLRASAGNGVNTLVDGNLGAVGSSNVVYNATVEIGGAIIDTNGENKSVDQPLVVGEASGGGLTKQGAGNLYLNEFNTYDGETLVTEGNLGGEGDVAGNVTLSAGAGLAYFENDPGIPSGGLFVGGSLTLPDPLEISIDSGGGDFFEESATGLVIAEANSIVGSPATITLETSSFTGFGEWSNPRVVGNQVLIDYTAGEGSPFTVFMDTFFPGETDPEIVGPDADPDGDDVSNINEFAYGGNPNLTDGGGPRSFGVSDVGGTDFFTLTIAVPSGATFAGGIDAMTASIEGLDLTVEGTDGLDVFDSLITEIAPIFGDLPTVPDGYEYKTFQLNPDVSAGLGFMRNGAVETPDT